MEYIRVITHLLLGGSSQWIRREWITSIYNWLALPVGNEGINLYIGILGMKLPSFPTKGQLDKAYKGHLEGVPQPDS